MPQYQILRMDVLGTPPLNDLVFKDPAEAAAYAKAMGKLRGEKLCVKTIKNEQWKLRERARILGGTYRSMPWNDQRWWVESYAIWKDHFAHPSIEKPGWLAYTRTEEDGVKDKQTVVRPGTYLSRYFEKTLHNYGVTERRAVEQFMVQYGPVDIKFAVTEDEIIKAYEYGPNTCMQGKEWPKDGRNPAYIYAAGDLQVAYLGDLEDGPSARVLVWPQKKIHSRIYGDIARMTTGLARLGYKWGAPIGAKLKRVPLKPVKFDPGKGALTGCFLAPYIDKKNQQGGGHLSVLDKGDHLVICEEGVLGSHHCGLPDGYSGAYVPRADEHPTFTCDHCDVAGWADTLPVVVEDVEEGEEQSWCRICARKHAFRCAYSGGLFHNDVDRVVVEGDLWASYYADMYAATCEMSGELCHGDNLRRVYVSGKPKKISESWLRHNGGYFKSHITGNLHLARDKITLYGDDGSAVAHASNSELPHHAFQCDGCEKHSKITERHQTHGDDRLFCGVCNRNEKINPKFKFPKQLEAAE